MPSVAVRGVHVTSTHAPPQSLISYAPIRPLVNGPSARQEKLTVTFLVSINLAHCDITIDNWTQKSLIQDVKLCTNPS